MSHTKLFPGYVSESEARQIQDAGLEDRSWENDAAPFWYLPNDNDPILGLMTDHPDCKEREVNDPTGKRFAVVNHLNCEILTITDDLSEAIERFKTAAKEMGLL